MQFVFPADPLNSNRIDEFFKPQAAVLNDGYPAVFSLEEGKVSRILAGETVVYRGWMLNEDDYTRLSKLVEEAGAMLACSTEQYLNTHHIPKWYELLRDFTAETVVFTNQWLRNGDLASAIKMLKNIGWEKFLLKDYVKSLKTAGGSFITEPEDAPKVVELMEKYRGNIEGGICVRKFEQLTDERRYFILNGQTHPRDTRYLLDEAVLTEVAKRIDSPFFSVDMAYDITGRARVVEIGDGQVSDLVEGWTPVGFGRMFRQGLTPSLQT